MRGPLPQAVILASDTGARLYPLNGPGTPKALLPVGNRTLLSFPLAMIEHSGIRHVLVVCSGDETAGRVQSWIERHYEGDLHLEVRAVAAGLGSADALRVVADSLVADAVAVLSADLVSDVPLAAVLAAHTVRGAAATSLLAARRGLASAECKPGKAPKNVDYVGLDASGQTLLFFAASPDARRDIGLPLPALRRAGVVTLRTDLSDAHCYVFDRQTLLAALEARPGHSSLKQDVLPYMVRHQFDRPQARLEALRSDSLKLQAALDGGLSSSVRDFVADMSHAYRSGGAGDMGHGAAANKTRGGAVGAYMAGADRFCARANTPHNYGEINRDVATPALATRLLGPATNPRHENWMEPPKRLGTKATVGAGCIIAAGAEIGDKTSVKRSVIGPKCVLGNNVKVINSVLMDRVTVADGAHIQGSILCDGVHVEQFAILRDCQVGAGYTVTEQSEHRSEALAHAAKATPGGTPNMSAVGSPTSDSSSS